MLVRLLFVFLSCFSVMVNAATVIEADWRLDEFDWTGQANEVVDSSGSDNHGQSNGVLYSTAIGALCGAVDLTANSSSDYISLNRNALNGATDFSIAYWGKLPSSVVSTQTQTVLSGAAGGSDEEVIIRFVQVSDVWRYQFIVNGYTIQLNNYFPNDDAWHHFIWTRNASQQSGVSDQYCLYIDGASIGCAELGQTGQVSIDSGGLILGQRQTSVGAGLSSNSDWEGYIDELLIFRSVVSSEEADGIYQNYQSGLNWEGSVRTCPVPDLPLAQGDWHLDKERWLGVDSEVTDYSGNGFDGKSNIAMDSLEEGVVCRAADFTAAPVTDYISLDAQAFDGLNDFTYSVWGKSQHLGNQALISVYGNGNQNEFLLFFDSDNFTRVYFHENQYDFSGPLNFADNQWHHFALVRSGGEMCLYFDGERFDCVSVANAPLAASTGGVVIGQEQDSLQGGFSSTQDWEGYIDEPLLFSSALTGRQVAQIFANQQGGLNYDGSSRRCDLPPTVLNYRFDSCNWSNSQDVIDSGPNSLDAFAVNGVLSTIDGKICGLAQFDSEDDYVTLPDNSLVDISDELTVTTWVRIKSVPSSLKTILSKDNNYEFHVNSNLQVFWWWYNQAGQNGTVTSTIQLSLNQWHQVSIVHADGLQRIFIDGQEAGRATFAGPLVNNNNDLQIGQDQGLSDRFFDGDIDEVKIFDAALTEFELRDIYNNENAGRNYDGGLRACNCVEPNQVDHYRVSHAENLVSCMATDIRIQAHDSSHSLVSAGGRTITVSTSTGKGEWLGVTSGSGVLGSSSAGEVTYTFPDNGESEVVLSFAYPDLSSDTEIVNFNVTDGESTDLRDESDPEDLNLTVSESGFVFDIPDTASCLSSATVRLRAVKKSDSSASCAAAISGTQQVSFSSQYSMPSSGSAPVLISALGVEYSVSEGVNTPVTLSFDANGEAEFSAAYADAGQLSLAVSLQTSVNTLIGGDQWVTYPAQLQVAASDTDGGGLHNADLSSGAVWQAARPFNLSIIAQCADGTPTPNYQPSSAMLSAQLESPLMAEGAVSGVLALASGSIDVEDVSSDLDVSSVFSSGTAAFSATYDEVGVLSVAARDDDYFGHQIPTQSVYVGRFVPAFLAVSANTPEMSAYCPSGGFNYLDDWLSFQVAPEFTVQPRSYTGAITYNYGADLWRLSDSVSERTFEDQSTAVNASLESVLGSGGDWQETQADFSGEAVLALLDDQVRYVKGATEVPFAGSFDIVLSAADLTDADLVCYKQDSDGDNDWLEESCQGFRLGAVNALSMRYGRLWLENAYGPETESLAVPWLVQYFDGQQFVVNELDSCSAWLESEVVLSDVEGTLIADDKSSFTYGYAGSDFRVEAGDADIKMSAPGESFSGTINMQIDMTRFPFLLWDRDGDGVLDAPEADITFGQYRSHDRVIFQRQN